LLRGEELGQDFPQNSGGGVEKHFSIGTFEQVEATQKLTTGGRIMDLFSFCPLSPDKL